jgi:hypothetical protein
MKWVHRFFALACALPLLAWLSASAMVVYIGSGDPCAGRDPAVERCTLLGVDIGEWAMLAGFYASWGYLVLVPISVASAVLWALVALAVRRRRRRARDIAAGGAKGDS